MGECWCSLVITTSKKKYVSDFARTKSQDNFYTCAYEYLFDHICAVLLQLPLVMFAVASVLTPGTSRLLQQWTVQEHRWTPKVRWNVPFKSQSFLASPPKKSDKVRQCYKRRRLVDWPISDTSPRLPPSNAFNWTQHLLESSVRPCTEAAQNVCPMYRYIFSQTPQERNPPGWIQQNPRRTNSVAHLIGGN